MTGDLTLKLLDGANVTYTLSSDDGLAPLDLTLTERVGDDGELEQGTVELAANGLLMGAASRAELPAVSVPGARGGGYRAQLSHRGAVVAEGVVPRSEIRRAVSDQTWTLTMLASAWEEVRTRLSETALTSVDVLGLDILNVDWYQEVTLRRGSDTSRQLILSRTLGQPALAACRLDTVVTSALSSSAVALDGALPPWMVDGAAGPYESWPYVACRARWDVGHGPEPALPLWTCLELVEAVAADAGWTIAARYDEFPSRQPTVSVSASTGAPAGGQALDGYEAAGGWEEGSEPSDAEAAVGVAWSNWRDDQTTAWEPAALAGDTLSYNRSVPPLVRARVALSDWTWDRETAAAVEQEPEPADGAPHVSRFMVAQTVGRPYDDTDATSSLLLTRLDHVDLLSVRYRVGYPLVGASGAYLLDLVNVATGNPATLRAVQVHSRESIATGTLYPGATWAETLYAMRHPALGEAETLSGRVVESALAAVPAAGSDVQALAQSWRLRERQRRLADGTASYQLVRYPAGQGAPDVRDVTPGPVREITPASYNSSNAIGQSFNTFGVTWLPPVLDIAQRVAYYELQWRDDSTPDYSAWTRCDAPAWFGGTADIGGGELVHVRVRAVTEAGVAGPVEYLAFHHNPE